MTVPIPEDLVIAAYGNSVPCVMQLMPDGCEFNATWLIRMEHADGTVLCGSPAKVPFCDYHKRLMEQTFIGFWADLTPPPPCAGCEQHIRISDIVPISAAS